jgi:hypothetical protein
MGVSKQDWKDYQSNKWAGGPVKPALDELMQAFDGLTTAIDAADAPAFLAYTEDEGKLMQAATKAMQASQDAVTEIKLLRLEGNQRRFANKSAIAASDAAINAVTQYHQACGLLVSGLVRGVLAEYYQVKDNPSAISDVKSGDLEDRLDGERYRIKECYDFATDKVAALAAVEKIGVV